MLGITSYLAVGVEIDRSDQMDVVEEEVAGLSNNLPIK